MKVTFDWLEDKGYLSVTDYCRYLVEENSIEEVIEVYRGDMLCITVTDVKKAATVMPNNNRWVKYDKSKRKGSLQPRTAI